MDEIDAQFSDDVDQQYDLLKKLKPSGVNLYVPQAGWLWTSLLEIRIFLIHELFGFRPNYFVVRHRLPLSNRRSMDLIFIIHGLIDHEDHPPKRWWYSIEGWRWKWYWHFKYGREFMFFLHHQDTRKKKLKEFIDWYAWLYYGTYFDAVEAGMINLYHGFFTEPPEALG